ncbi:C6 transcription factor [Histoplasma capsulatum H143]|uniref:C6 transcription factor n=1 Tax=Ajellomyces capsulatus (strain H143) TaxID=544712 RepID=C6H710_AJECH|nr:C6 transcription factor [Histoplasma capsulatum H143]
MQSSQQAQKPVDKPILSSIVEYKIEYSWAESPVYPKSAFLCIQYISPYITSISQYYRETSSDPLFGLSTISLKDQRRPALNPPYLYIFKFPSPRFGVSIRALEPPNPAKQPFTPLQNKYKMEVIISNNSNIFSGNVPLEIIFRYGTYLVQLETRLKEYEKGHNNGAGRQESLDVVPLEYQHQQDPPATTLSGNSEPPTTTNEDDIDGNPLTEKIAHLVLSPEGDKRYIGNSSSASLGKKFLDFVRSFKTGLDIGEDFVTPAYNSCSNFSIRANAHQAKPFTTLLPPFPFAKRLYAAQYSYIGTIFSFTSPETFEKNIREMYDREVDFTNKRDCLRYCQIFIILAFGQMYSINQWTSYDGPPGFEYFQQAMSLLPAIHEQPSVTFVEVLSLGRLCEIRESPHDRRRGYRGFPPISLIRPLVFNVVRKCLQNNEKTGEWPDWKEGLQQTTVLAVETCIAAARNSAAVMAAAAKKNLIATYGYMDGEHAFSAGIILVMINIAFPYNLRDRAAMVLALDVLNGMAEKGNLHIRSLHRLLLSLYHTLIPSPTESGDKPASAAPEHEHMSPQPAELAPPETSPTEHRPESQPIQLPHVSVDDPLAAFLAAQQSASPIPMSGDSGFIVPEELLSFENPIGDAILWEEGYGTFDVGMDFDWAQWNS